MKYSRFEELPVWQAAIKLAVFLYIARGSAGEARSMLCLLERLPRFDDLKFQVSNLKLASENVSRQLRAWADSLQNSEIKGQRRLHEKTQRGFQARKEREEFLEELRRAQEENIETRQHRRADTE